MAELLKSEIETPLGIMIVGATETGICFLNFKDTESIENQLIIVSKSLKLPIKIGENRIISELKIQLEEYFLEKREQFSIPIVLVGTDFQQLVWEELMKIPFGETRSYKMQSSALNNPKAVRAVANANAKNPILILVPCHRIVGSNGNLTGYSGGIWRKEALLKLEKCRLF